jgi:hypothetical protein
MGRAFRSPIDRRIVLEFDPLAVQHFSAHALATLLIGACAALVLLGATVVFWRLSLRAERAGTRVTVQAPLRLLQQAIG